MPGNPPLFDSLASQGTEWDTFTSATFGAFRINGGTAVRLGTAQWKFDTAFATVAVGVEYQVNSITEVSILQLQNVLPNAGGGNPANPLAHLTVNNLGDGRMYLQFVCSGITSAFSAVSPVIAETGIWVYLELKATLSSSQVVYELRANYHTVISGTYTYPGGQSIPTGFNYDKWSAVQLSGGTALSHFCDFYADFDFTTAVSSQARNSQDCIEVAYVVPSLAINSQDCIEIAYVLLAPTVMGPVTYGYFKYFGRTP